MADVVEAVKDAPAKAGGLATRRIGPLPVWAYVGGIVGGVLVFSLIRRGIGGGGDTAAAAAPKVSSQSAGPAAGPDTSQSGSSNNDSVLGQILAAIQSLPQSVAAAVTPASGGSAGSNGIATAPVTLVPTAIYDPNGPRIQTVAQDPQGRAALSIITTRDPFGIATAGSGLGSQPNAGATNQSGAPGSIVLTTSTGQETNGGNAGNFAQYGANLQDTGNAPGVTYENGNLVVH